MKVYIGRYPKYIGPYHVSNAFRYIGIPESVCDSIGDWLSEFSFFNWLDSKRKRKIKIRIDNYDTWNMDYTLALIILPMLKQLKENEKTGSLFSVDNEDVPKKLRSKKVKDPYADAESVEAMFKKWNWIMDEMIFAFDQILEDDCMLYKKETENRINNGVRMFGKYFRHLWN